jgi:ribosomal protein L37AE/L43A
MYDEHLKSKKHLRRKFRKESESLWYCEACKLKLPNDAEWVKILNALIVMLLINIHEQA